MSASPAELPAWRKQVPEHFGAASIAHLEVLAAAAIDEVSSTYPPEVQEIFVRVAVTEGVQRLLEAQAMAKLLNKTV